MDEKQHVTDYKTRLGLILFAVYCVVYAGFVLINTIKPKLMGSHVGSLNLAVFYGFGLIIFAVILGLIYNAMCSKVEGNEEEGEK